MRRIPETVEKTPLNVLIWLRGLSVTLNFELFTSKSNRTTFVPQMNWNVQTFGEISTSGLWDTELTNFQCMLTDTWMDGRTDSAKTKWLRDWIEQGLSSHQTHYRSYWGRVFMGWLRDLSNSGGAIKCITKSWKKKQVSKRNLKNQKNPVKYLRFHIKFNNEVNTVILRQTNSSSISIRKL